MRYLSRQIVFREVPDEISLAYMVTGCPRRCQGCHSSDSWNPHAGPPLSLESLARDLERYRSKITCVLFLGGDWCPEGLTDLLSLVRRQGFKTALYSGEEWVADELVRQLDYLKLGPYIADRGGLECPTTNQRIYRLATGECLNHLFISNEEGLHHGETERRSNCG